MPRFAEGNSTLAHVVLSNAVILLIKQKKDLNSGSFHTNNVVIHKALHPSVPKSNQVTLLWVWHYPAASGTLSQYSHLLPRACRLCRVVESVECVEQADAGCSQRHHYRGSINEPLCHNRPGQIHTSNDTPHHGITHPCVTVLTYSVLCFTAVQPTSVIV